MSEIPQFIIENKNFFRQLARTKSERKLRKLLKNASSQQLLALVELSLNILRTRFHLTTRQKKRLSPYANYVRGYILGYEFPQNINPNEYAKYKYDLRGGFSSFGVYAKGLTANMIIGNSLNSLLRIVSVSGAESGEIVEKIYDSPLFCQVLPVDVNEIEVEILTMDGRPVPFQSGNVMIVLIFKKVINF